jgi:hypothetical protein
LVWVSGLKVPLLFLGPFCPLQTVLLSDVLGVFFKGRENLLRKEHGVYFDEYERVLRRIPLSRPPYCSSPLATHLQWFL